MLAVRLYRRLEVSPPNTPPPNPARRGRTPPKPPRAPPLFAVGEVTSPNSHVRLTRRLMVKLPKPSPKLGGIMVSPASGRVLKSPKGVWTTYSGLLAALA